MKKLALSIALTMIFALTLTSFNKGTYGNTQDHTTIKVLKSNTLSFDWGDEDLTIPRL